MSVSKTPITVLLVIAHFFTRLTALYENCDYSANIVVGQIFYLHNPRYPSNYKASDSCRWNVTSSPNTKVVLSCENNIPNTTNCYGDRFQISLNGSSKFADAHIYCGRTLSLTSHANMILISFIAPFYSPGGNFTCTLTAVQLTNTIDTTEKPSICDCGRRVEKRVFGSFTVDANQFPWMAGLFDIQRRVVSCGATIISTRYALTAAHCFLKKYSFQTGLLVGDHDIYKSTDTDAAAIYRIEKYILHPKYVASTFQNDIAIVRTQDEMYFNLKVSPVCLPFRHSTLDFAGSTVTILGWGSLKMTEAQSDVLQGTALALISNAECQRKHLERPIFSTEMCTYTPGHDACNGDSGGPCLWMDPISARFQLIGIISYGLGCGTSQPAVNTRVTSYLSWIVSETPDAFYCIK